ncbi:MAG: uroporphyrinogen-III synthase, partial [Nannocystaceae bacterium]
ARHGGTLVLMMSVRNCRRNAERLVASGRDPETPAALVRWGTRGIQQTVVGTLASIGERVEAAKLRPPAVMIVGSVVGLRDQIKWVESRPLFGKRIVTTRAFDQSQGLIAGLSQLGADVVPVPCLRIEPTHPEHLAQELANLERYNGILVSSPNAAESLVTAVMARGDLRVLAQTSIAAIGPATTRALAALGLRPDIEADPAHSEGMVATLEGLGRLQDRWLHVRASTGRAVLADAIAAAGGHYTVVAAYRSVRPPVPGNLLSSLLLPEAGGEGFDAVCFASGKTARHFLTNLDELAGPGAGLKLLRDTQAKIVAIGPVTAQALDELGLTATAIASTPSDVGLIAAVRAALGSD